MATTTRWFCALLLAVVAPATALAADGVIEIDQAAADAGGITAGDTPGDPVTISETGSYVLTGDLSFTDIEINPPVPGQRLFVTLDLNGFTLLGGDVTVLSSGTVLRIHDGALALSDMLTAPGSSVLGARLMVDVGSFQTGAESIVREMHGFLAGGAVSPAFLEIERYAVVADSQINVASAGDGRSVVTRHTDVSDGSITCASQCVLRDLDASGATVSSGSGAGQYGGVVARSQLGRVEVTDGAVVYENDVFEHIALLPQTGAANIDALGAARNNIADANGFVNDTGGGPSGRIVEIAPNACNGGSCPVCTELLSCMP